jgi:hypothetical protein
MAESRVSINHLLVFAGDEERQHYLSPERTEAERREIRTELEEVYESIPDPTEAELRQFTGENTWRETQHNPSARDLPKAQWKGFRKADARKRLAESKRPTGAPKTEALGGTNEMWWGHFYISHLNQKERDRIKRGEFEPREIEMLAKGEDAWEQSRKPLPADLKPPASLPPFDEWARNVIEQFSPVAERVHQAAVDAALDHSPTPEEHERTGRGLDARHSLLPEPPKKKPKIDPQVEAHEAALRRQEQAQQRRRDEERDRASRTLESERDHQESINRSQSPHRDWIRDLSDQRALRKREELVEREERLQRQRESERRQRELNDFTRSLGFDLPAESDIRRESKPLERVFPELPAEKEPTQAQEEDDKLLPKPAFGYITGSSDNQIINIYNRFATKSLSEKIQGFTESNLFWGGGIGMARLCFSHWRRAKICSGFTYPCLVGYHGFRL